MCVTFISGTGHLKQSLLQLVKNITTAETLILINLRSRNKSKATCSLMAVAWGLTTAHIYIAQMHLFVVQGCIEWLYTLFIHLQLHEGMLHTMH